MEAKSGEQGESGKEWLEVVLSSSEESESSRGARVMEDEDEEELLVLQLDSSEWILLRERLRNLIAALPVPLRCPQAAGTGTAVRARPYATRLPRVRSRRFGRRRRARALLRRHAAQGLGEREAGPARPRLTRAGARARRRAGGWGGALPPVEPATERRRLGGLSYFSSAWWGEARQIRRLSAAHRAATRAALGATRVGRERAASGG